MADRVLSPLIGKSFGLYLRKPLSGAVTPRHRGVLRANRLASRNGRCPQRRAGVPGRSAGGSGVLSASDVLATAHSIAEVQRPDGLIPWFDGGHSDPWNHVEARWR